MIKIGQYDYKGLIKSYLAQDRPSASTASTRLSYSGAILYSYKSILATISQRYPNTIYIDKDISEFSKTSSKQTGILLNSARSNWNVFVIDLDQPIDDNLSVYWREVELLIKRHQRARTRRPQIKQQLHELIHTTQHFAELHKLDTAIPDHIMRQLFIYQLLL